MGSVEPHFDSKLHFHRKVWISLMSFECHIYPYYVKYTFKMSTFILLPVKMSKIAEKMANSVNADQKPRFACLHECIKYSKLIKLELP